MACFIKFWLFIDFLSYKFLFSQVKLVFVYWLQVWSMRVYGIRTFLSKFPPINFFLLDILSIGVILIDSLATFTSIEGLYWVKWYLIQLYIIMRLKLVWKWNPIETGWKAIGFRLTFFRTLNWCFCWFICWLGFWFLDVLGRSDMPADANFLQIFLRHTSYQSFLLVFHWLITRTFGLDKLFALALWTSHLLLIFAEFLL